MRYFTTWGTFALILLSGAQLVAAEPTHRVFFGNLHSHTSYSDGVGTPEIAYQHARDVAKLDFLAITEHNHASAGRIANDPDLYSGAGPTSLISTAGRFTKGGQFVAIFGQEFSSISSGNHANVFEIGEVIDTRQVPNGAWDVLLGSWLPSHPDSQGQPPLMLLNHPAISSSPNSKEYGIDDFASFGVWRDKLDPHAQLINIINGPSHGNANPGRPSESEFRRYLNMGLHLAPTADQDNHRHNWGSAADTRTAVVAVALTKPDIMAALRARHVYATEDKNLRVIARVNGELMGTIFQGQSVPSQNSALSVELEIKDDDEPSALYTIDVYADEVGGTEDADVVRQFERQGDGRHTLDGLSYAGGRQYFFLKITQTDDDHMEIDRAWTAPIWFEPQGGGVVTPGVPSLTLTVNLQTERATITNRGSMTINLGGWTLRSVRGDQKYRFAQNFHLAPGASVVVASGPDAVEDFPKVLKWKKTHIWRNAGDPGELIDTEERIRAESD